METVTLQGPSRNTIRLIYDMALGASHSDAARQIVTDALRFQEILWKHEDMKKKEVVNADNPHQPNGE